MRITNNERAPKILGVLKLSLVLALVAILPLSALMAGLLNSRNAVSTLGNNSVQQQVDNGNTAVSRDYSELAGKYIGLFVANDNGTVTLDIGNKANRAMIEDEDLQALQEYAEMIENVNALVEDGTLYIAEDGNYYMVEDVAENNLARGFIGGKNEFYVRSQKFWFLWLPVGYHIELSSWGAILLGAISGIAGAGGAALILKGISAVSAWIVSVLTVVASTVATAFLDANLNTLFNIVYSIYVGGMAVMTAISVLSGGIGSIVAFLLNMLGTYIFWTIGNTFLQKGIQIAVGSDNTVVCDTNLILQNSSYWTYRY